MRVTVKLYATLSDYLPGHAKNNRVEVEATDTATVTEVLQPFALPSRLTHLVLVNGTYIPPDERADKCLAEGDVLAVWPPIAGG
ncbi:MoaD/ThiS family protein [Dechloromonas sp. ARDL1]|uniref:MoaD/ThiS family protein n=1 Tax=Dechloromonas sp. ARDL1 TaxID=3322121 RepID=UPI003DA7260F